MILKMAQQILIPHTMKCTLQIKNLAEVEFRWDGNAG